MAKSTCSVEGCNKPRGYANGLCGMHYQRWRRHGSLDNPKPPPCNVPGCTKQFYARGLCGMHYTRWRNHGDPSIRKNLLGESIETRFWDKVDKNGPIPNIGPCWLWTGSRSSNGRGGDFYGHMRNNGSVVAAHRVAYELFVEAIPLGLEIDHVCKNTLCVNPRHLRVVGDLGQSSNQTNANLEKNACPQGHPYNSYRQSGARRCTICEVEKKRQVRREGGH